MFPEKLQRKLAKRAEDHSLRRLTPERKGIDFYSNDYLGFAQSQEIRQAAAGYAKQFSHPKLNGATGARLISGNSKLATAVEAQLARFHQAEAGLLFNSGYDANLGFFSCVPQRGDTVLYDERIHASIRDGIRLSLSHSVKFKHNDHRDLESKLKRQRTGDTYIAIESLYSMDGDSPDLEHFAALAKWYGALLVVDEAHATGVLGERGSGLVQALHLQAAVFARIHTFGKAIGAHGAIVLGSAQLTNFLVNFAHAFIYTTALPPHSLAGILAAYDALHNGLEQRRLMDNIRFFLQEVKRLKLQHFFSESPTPIQRFRTEDREMLRAADKALGREGFLVKYIQPPTVPPKQACLRISLHSFNRREEIQALLQATKGIVRHFNG